MKKFHIGANFFRGRHVCLQVAVLLYLVLVYTSSSWGQDVAAMAREEQARKQALPAHQNHVYTNDDLARPRILTPDDLEFRSAQKGWKPGPALVELPPDAVAESDAPVISLGELARQNNEQKLARRQQSRLDTLPERPAHVYTNEDMARPRILTPEDHAMFEAAQKNQMPTLERRALEIASGQMEIPNIPLGDLARLYRKKKPVPEVPAPREFHLLLNNVSFASPAIPRSPQPARPRPKPARRPAHLLQAARRAPAPASEITGVRMITVKPGDSLWSLARQYLGQGHRWHTLLAASPWIRNPNRLSVGSQIRI